jgi:hypothetical protein
MPLIEELEDDTADAFPQAVSRNESRLSMTPELPLLVPEIVNRYFLVETIHQMPREVAGEANVPTV